jgi:hypothetical protein
MSGVLEEREKTRGRDQSDETGALSAVLAETEEQAEERNQQNSTADANHSGGDTTKHSDEGDTDDAEKAMRFLGFGNGGCLCRQPGFSPQEEGREDQDETEDAAEITRWQGDGDAPTEITANEKAEGAEDAGAEIDLAVPPVAAQSAETDGGKENEQRRTLRQMLIVAQKVDHGGYQDDAAADAEQSYEDTDGKTQSQNDDDLHDSVLPYHEQKLMKG